MYIYINFQYHNHGIYMYVDLRLYMYSYFSHLNEESEQNAKLNLINGIMNSPITPIFAVQTGETRVE